MNHLVIKKLGTHNECLLFWKEGDAEVTEYKTREQKRKFYNSTAWKHLRKFVRERDHNECQECKRQGKVFIDIGEKNRKGTRKKIALIVHHIKELEDYPELAHDVSNLETLC